MTTYTTALEALATTGVTFTGWERRGSRAGLDFQGRHYRIHKTYLLMDCFQNPGDDLTESLKDFDG